MRILGRVEQLLSGNQRYRDSDKLLLLAFWHTQGLVLTEQQRQIFMDRCATAESITRARRALKGKYPASQQVDDERFDKFKQYRQGEIV